MAICIAPLFVFAQQTHNFISGLYTRTNAYTYSSTDAFSFKTNQAALANTKTLMAGLVSERRFMMQELSMYQATLVLPANNSGFGLVGTYFGHENNREVEIGLAYGRKVNNNISIGTQFNFQNQKIPAYQGTNALSVQGGILLRVTDQVQAGFHIYHPIALETGQKESRLPKIFTTGIGYEVSESVIIGAEVQKTEGGKANIMAGLEYKFHPLVFARMAVSSELGIYTIGSGVLLNKVRLDIAASIHPHLGVTPGLILFYKP